MNNQDIRWIQRFENFSKACALLSEINNYKLENTIAIIREGFIQRFEIAFDLAWKTARDFLEFEGVSVQPTPRSVIKEAFSADVIGEGQTFIEMLEARNLMSHRYDEETFNAVFLQIQQKFYPALEKLRVFLEGRKA
ncbi:MAG: nucleotidyltransferase substrate binding protein [Oscillospiraceae bacterium]|nr:nucleotidyltransferase substrate binding protein [Oscillospiraceae bacterium]